MRKRIPLNTPKFLTMLELDHIHEQDCFAALTAIDDQSVDVVLTDPPYPNHAGVFTDSLVDGLAAIYLSCKKAKRYVAFFWNPVDPPQPPPGWYEVARHIWRKRDSRALAEYEIVVVWSQDPKRKRSRVYDVPIVDLRSLREWSKHPTQKPVRLLRYLLEQLTNEGDIVLDPFVGSGTTAVACQQMKRHYIGVEKNHEFAQIAITRTTRPSKEDQAEAKIAAANPDGQNVPDEQVENTTPKKKRRG